MAVSKALGLGIVVGSSLVKLPQVKYRSPLTLRLAALQGPENRQVWERGGDISYRNLARARGYHGFRGLQLQPGLPLQFLRGIRVPRRPDLGHRHLGGGLHQGKAKCPSLRRSLRWYIKALNVL